MAGWALTAEVSSCGEELFGVGGGVPAENGVREEGLVWGKIDGDVLDTKGLRYLWDSTPPPC